MSKSLATKKNMFSDSVFDAMFNLLKECKPDYAYPEVYNREAVIDMLTHMRYVILLSDNKKFAERKPLAMYNCRLAATKDYDKAMSSTD